VQVFELFGQITFYQTKHVSRVWSLVRYQTRVFELSTESKKSGSKTIE
jgi:hypothetical protein